MTPSPSTRGAPGATLPFGRRLAAALDERGSLCVGIDPHPELLQDWGLPDSVDGLARFADSCVEALAGVTAVLKPQSAFFEAYGSAGIAVLERTVRRCREAGALVLLDVKRGDIGSTMAAYARAYLDPAAPLAADAITASPYLGVGALEPAFEQAALHGGGVFVLAATSNPEGARYQRATVAGGAPVAQDVVDELADRNRGETPVGSFGVVFGATVSGDPIALDALNGPILAPGVGAQGGSAESVRRIFGDALPAVLPSVSREVLRRGPDPGALREAVGALVNEFGFLRR